MGPIGGGFAAFGIGSAGAVVVVAEASGGGVGVPSSTARTTSLLEILLPCLEGKEILVLGVEFVFGVKLDFSTTQMLHLPCYM